MNKRDHESFFVSESEGMKRILSLCPKIAAVDSTVLIHGESGTGKSVLAHYIHKLSGSQDQPFLTINCASIPENLLESELFGYSAGAFTGAQKYGKIGLIEAANHGTLFLDEIGELPLGMQAKLLHVIQHQEYLPIGELKTKKVNIRIIAATNRDLNEMVRKKQFREDLYYRLNVIDIQVPPLRERKEDIVTLVNFFLLKNNDRFGVTRRISKAAMHLLKTYIWPGNIRQLENLLEKLVVTTNDVIDVKDLPDYVHSPAKPIIQKPTSTSLESTMAEVEKKLVIESYRYFKSSRQVADFLQISQSKASRLIRKHCNLQKKERME